MRRALLLTAALVLVPVGWNAATAAVDPPSQGASARVEMGSNFYAPREVRVDVGGTVTWEALGNGHDVRADDGSFWLWRGETGGNDGQTRAVTFDEPGVVPYHCTLHGGPGGNGMSGIVFVGDAEIDTPPELTVPSDEHPTLRAALRTARRGTTITLGPGVHRAGQRLTQPGVTIRGDADAAPGEVVLRAATAAGLRVEADDITLADLTIDAGSRSGIEALGVDRLRLEDVRITTEQVGVRFDGGRGLTILGGEVRGHDRAGVLVTGCDPCDARIEGLRAADNLLGIDVVDAAGAIVRRNVLEGNGVGIRAADTPAGPLEGARTLTILDNEVRDNDAGGPALGPDAELPVATGAGIWLAGARQTVVHDNVVDGDHRTGISITALAGPSRDVVVRDNVVSGAREADLAWDGLGLDVCFSGNATPGGDEPSSSPPQAQTLYACDLPATVGIPNPPALRGLLEGATGSGGGDDAAPASAGTADEAPARGLARLLPSRR